MLGLVTGFLAAATVLAGSTAGAALEGRSYDTDLNTYALREEQWPYGPAHTEGRHIVNSRGDKIKWAGINWPMSGETMVPEGLEKRPAGEILDDLGSMGMNFLRMGYSATMVDEVYESDQDDVPLEAAMIKALGYYNGTRVTSDVVKHNPSWNRTTGRFQIWGDIVDMAAERGMFVHPDMHIAKAGWCCGHDDGSAWFGDENFNVKNWTRALSYVADWAKDFPNIVSMALVNELRQPWVDDYPKFGYNWMTLVGNMTLGSDAIHEANPDLLISWSGLQFDEDLSALTSGTNLLTSPCYMCVSVQDSPRRDPVVFNLDDHAWGDKVFYELHLYTMTEDLDIGTCDIIKAQLYRAGFNALGMDRPKDCDLLENHHLGPCREPSHLTPVAMTEFGTAQDETLLNNSYIDCLREFTTENDVSWAMWSVAGSYRVRSGGQNVNDTWGMMNFDWDGFRFEEGVEEIWRPWVQETNVTKKD
ncbi:uncharacterized protein J7T54_006898 [Emericellopsis cladophorae]|uniref:Glycoside hydrolase family 5 domain-containing protein n=1 Tax=Emericellopsis cladophorae TaxID=2686198 RepID=A0A9Q0BHM2_9HYPO|nr:uncharacterized protein J7T54_006898 [Emericellopsis cladophorae]KAI6785256.1 hypothetical protein J7T54_006898 [Emericellopsis cladophorae]